MTQQSKHITGIKRVHPELEKLGISITQCGFDDYIYVYQWQKVCRTTYRVVAGPKFFTWDDAHEHAIRHFIIDTNMKWDFKPLEEVFAKVVNPPPKRKYISFDVAEDCNWQFEELGVSNFVCEVR